ncbi:efflux RND transporter periplasmic adaptor subunit [Verrucomicrobiaceae bacterium N1E253]|uniref:Efflux RND transporter periplasmic adaptor subunit n=1 Tax=Oceaniferula marina TaxID=2748318 RepID=A0A851GL88_9BACT|nr:efflux RND transporter periplasmic adaptor subunit [Oceaniferula marina]NWK55510.1 efflux RND transporter periplasmic adaptor subunit [Oceaniferula marina]
MKATCHLRHALLLSLSLSATSPLFLSCGEKNTFAPPPPTPVGVQTPIVRDQMTYFEFPGHLEALQTVELRARVKGILNTVSPDFKPGHRIKEGTVVFGIDDIPYQAALKAAEGNLAKAKADLDIAEITLQRRQTAAEAISKIQIDAAKADVDAANALVKSAEASVIDAKETLSWCKITAPISGRISELEVDQFNLVGNNEATLLSTIVQDDTLRVYFDINERMALLYLKDRKAMQANQPGSTQVTLTLANGTPYEHPATIDYADNKLDADTGTIRIRAIVPNPEEKLADGLFVKVKVPSPASSKDSVLIPAIAIQQDLGGHFALIVDKDNKVVRKNLTLGDSVNRLRIIKEGLTGKEKVIVQGLQRVREGIVVDPSPMPPAEPEKEQNTKAASDKPKAEDANAKAAGTEKAPNN